MKLGLFYVLALALLISSCASVRQAPLLPMSDAYVEQQTVHRIVIEQGDQHHEFIAGLTLSAQQIQVVGLSHVGQRLFSLYYDGADVVVDSLYAEDIPAQMIIGDIMLAYGEINALQAVLPKHWALKQQGATRQLFHRRKEVINISYLGTGEPEETLLIDHVDQGFQLYISTIN